MKAFPYKINMFALALRGGFKEMTGAASAEMEKTMNIIGIIGLLTAVIGLMYFVYRGIDVVVMTILCSLFISVTSGLNPVETFMNVYMERFGVMVGMLGAIFIFGAIIGSVYQVSGGAYSLVRFFSNHIRTDNEKIKIKVSVLCVMIITVGLGYFGVDTLVLIFLTVPICTQFCRQNNWPAKYVPVLVLSGPLANIMPGAAQNHNIIPTKFLNTHPMASALPGFIACAVGFVLIWLYTSRAIEKSVAAGEGYEENEKLKSASAVRENYPHPVAAFLPLLSIFICFNLVGLKIEVCLFIGTVLAILLMFRYIDDLQKALSIGVGNAARTIVNFGALIGFAKVAISTPVFTGLVEGITSIHSIPPVVLLVLATAVFTAIGNSGTSGITASMEAFSSTFLKLGVPASVIHRAVTLTGATLDTLPTNSGVIIALNLTGSTHRQSYKYVFVNTVAIPCVVVMLYVMLITLFPGIG